MGKKYLFSMLIMSFVFVIINISNFNINNESFFVSQTTEEQTQTQIQTTDIQWKAVFDEPGDNYNLYITVNNEKDYYVGDYLPGVNFELNENSLVSDAPKEAITTLSTLWTGEGQWFYIYQKSENELAVMYHNVIYSEWYISSLKKEIGESEYKRQYEEYEEVLIIPIKENTEIQAEDSIIIDKDEIN